MKQMAEKSIGMALIKIVFAKKVSIYMLLMWKELMVKNIISEVH